MAIIDDDLTRRAAEFPCRIDGSRGCVPILSLGSLPLANALPRASELATVDARYPLELVFSPSTTLVQIMETVPPEHLFGDYVYFSSFSDTMVEHARVLVERLIARQRLDGSKRVVEVASNDGYLLQHYQRAGVAVLGVEPAANVAEVAVAKGIPTRVAFFGEECARALVTEGGQADVIHAHNVLAHVADLNGVVAGFAKLLRDDGVLVVEVPYVKDMIDSVEFDTIYHEHLCYFSLTALVRLFARHGLIVDDVERVAIHGGTLRLFAAHERGGRRAGPRTEALLEQEHAWGVDRPEFYRDFARRVETLKTSLVSLLSERKRAGRRIAAYGAAAKGAILLNYCGLGPELIDFVADRSTYKQGRFVPGVRLPIVAPARIVEHPAPDDLLLLAWNFADEIIAQQHEFRRRGGQFIVPVPTPHVVE